MHGLRQVLSWCDNKGHQKDTDARWKKKHSRSHIAYKNYIQIDHDNKPETSNNADSGWVLTRAPVVVTRIAGVKVKVGGI